MHNSNSTRVVQVTLEGDPLEEMVVWVFIGIFSAEVLDIEDNSWSVELNNKILSKII